MAHKTLVEVRTRNYVTVYANTAKEAINLAEAMVLCREVDLDNFESIIQAVEEEEIDTMLVFSERKKLENLFIDWCKENDTYECPSNMIVFLQSNGLLNEEEALEFIKENA